MPHMHGYVFLRDGKHPGRDIFHCKRAQPQIRLLRQFADERGLTLVLCFDYTRNKVTHLGDLPVLQRELAKIAARGETYSLVVDCLGQLLQWPDFAYRKAFMHELSAFDTHLFGIRQKRRLCRFDEHQKLLLMTMPPVRRSAKAGRTGQRITKPMTQASSSSRKMRSTEATVILSEIRQQLIEQGQPSRLKDIAAEANARGYLTQRRTPWTEQAVSVRLRALRQDSTILQRAEQTDGKRAE